MVLCSFDASAKSDGRSQVGRNPGKVTLGERPMFPRERERTHREDELRLHEDGDSAVGLIVVADGGLPIWDKLHDCPVTGHVEYQCWCELCVTDVSCKDVQQRCWIADKHLVSDVFISDVTSIMDAKNAFAMKLHSSDVVPVEYRVDEPMHQEERSACDERCAEWVRHMTFGCDVLGPVGTSRDSWSRREKWNKQCAVPICSETRARKAAGSCHDVFFGSRVQPLWLKTSWRM